MASPETLEVCLNVALASPPGFFAGDVGKTSGFEVVEAQFKEVRTVWVER